MTSVNGNSYPKIFQKLHDWNDAMSKKAQVAVGENSAHSYSQATRSLNETMAGFIGQTKPFIEKNKWAASKPAKMVANVLKPLASGAKMPFGKALAGGALVAFAAGTAVSAFNVGKTLLTQGPGEALKETGRSAAGIGGGLVGAAGAAALTGITMMSPVGWVVGTVGYLAGSAIAGKVAEGILGKNPTSGAPTPANSFGQTPYNFGNQHMGLPGGNAPNIMYPPGIDPSLMMPPGYGTPNNGLPFMKQKNPFGMPRQPQNPWQSNPFLASYPGAQQYGMF
ncbi:MAG: hypothetical protein VKJ06_03630 [Vampirovibrionales bacterium]|nr:hypothetical protein [Vampirovibrionales bacterium]